MSLVAAIGAILAGVILGWIGYGGLALCALSIVVVVTASVIPRTSSKPQPAEAIVGR